MMASVSAGQKKVKSVHLQDYELDLVRFDLLHNVLHVIRIQRAVTTGDEHDLLPIFQMLAKFTDHFNSHYDGR